MPLQQRARFGARRGAIVGAFFFGLIWLRALTADPSAPSVLAPISSAAAMIVGFAIAGASLFAIKRYMRSLPSAIGIAVGCSVPVWSGILVATTTGLSLHTAPVVGLASFLSGAIWGTMSWRARHS